MQIIDPTSAIRKALIVILCVMVAAALVLYASISQAFTFKVQNNLDLPVNYSLFVNAESINGQISPFSDHAIESNYPPGEYSIIWSDPNGEWDSEAVFEIPADTTENASVTVSIDFYPFHITVLKAE